MKRLSTRTLIVAGVIYAGILVALGIAVSPVLYLLLIVLAFARPVLREVRLLSDRDEWLTLISYRSSHIAFLAAMLIAGLIFLQTGVVEGREPPYEVSLILFIPLFVKFAALQMLGRSRERAGRRIAWLIGGAWLLFVLASHGFSATTVIEGSPWIAVLGLAYAARRWPRIAGAALVILGIASLIFFVDFPIEYKRLIVPFLLPLPLILAGVLLVLGDREESHEE